MDTIIDFNVDPESGLTGVCDFLVSLSPTQFHLETPIIILVEAKKDNPALGFGQCVAEMIAAQRFNKEKGMDIPPHLWGCYDRHNVAIPQVGKE